MQIGMFDTTSFEVLKALLEGPPARNEREKKVLRRVCKTCIIEFDKLGKTLGEFAANTQDNPDLFDFLAKALREAKERDFLFRSAAQLFSEIGSVKNAINHVSNGSVKKVYYELALSFSSTLKEVEKCKAAA